ncbi:MAG TPA: phosphohydrolase [Chitinophagaceae bacterium]|nr:phosphohydrolase [Chitinophagaceae bacterium]
MQHAQIIEATVAYVKKELSNAEAGHDWFHIQRVWTNAKIIGAQEPVNMTIVELGALLHDIADAKFHNGDEEIGPAKSSQFLRSISADEEIIEHVAQIIRHISFKGGRQTSSFESPELFVVRDADRLDALGAIGIARAFHYGGFKSRLLFDPMQAPVKHLDAESYRNNHSPTINHFYEKLLLLKDLMHTESGKNLAENRHLFMESFLQQFYTEWYGGDTTNPFPDNNISMNG